MKSTFCPHLWDGFTIIRTGDVFSCCKIKPVRLGNIYRTRLIDLVNVPEAVEHRRKSLEGELWCYEECNFIRKNNGLGTIPDNVEIDYLELKRLDILFGEQCNISCIMCKQAARRPRRPEVLNPDVLVEKVDISPFEDIILQGGEPLFIPECLAYMGYLESAGKRYTLLTNGLLIDDAMADRLSRHANRVIISLNAATREVHEKVNRGSRFDRVIDNIERLRSSRRRNGGVMRIIGRMTLTVPSLHEIPLFIQKYKELGFDGINFGYDKETVPGYLASNTDLTDQIRSEVVRAMKGANRGTIDSLRLEQLGLYPTQADGVRYQY
ncbi:MAG: radical SAM protein [Thermoplasmata archaeon]